MGLSIFMLAFNELMPSRPDGGMIPWSVIKDWGTTFNDDEEFLDDLMYHVREMDVAYMNWKKNTKVGNVSSSGGKPSPKTRRQFSAG